jgi:hypothetical protein
MYFAAPNANGRMRAALFALDSINKPLGYFHRADRNAEPTIICVPNFANHTLKCASFFVQFGNANADRMPTICRALLQFAILF